MFSLRHIDPLMHSVAPITHDLQMALRIDFTLTLEKPLRAKKRNDTDSLSERADFLRARVTWRLLNMAVNNVCGGLATYGRCGVHLLSL